MTRRIRRNNLLCEVQEARKELAKEETRAKRAKKVKEKDDDDKNGGAGTGSTQSAPNAPKKKSGRKPMSEARRLAVLAVQRVRRARERLNHKCSVCIRNLAKRCYSLNAATVEWIDGTTAAADAQRTAFPALC